MYLKMLLKEICQKRKKIRIIKFIKILNINKKIQIWTKLSKKGEKIISEGFVDVNDIPVL